MKKFIYQYLKYFVLFVAIVQSSNISFADRTLGYSVFSRNSYRTQESVVYVTRTGTKYHKSSCRYLSQSKIKTTLKKAIAAGNGACKVCKP
jgi:hypothetical protein